MPNIELLEKSTQSPRPFSPPENIILPLITCGLSLITSVSFHGALRTDTLPFSSVITAPSTFTALISLVNILYVLKD